MDIIHTWHSQDGICGVFSEHMRGDQSLTCWAPCAIQEMSGGNRQGDPIPALKQLAGRGLFGAWWEGRVTDGPMSSQLCSDPCQLWPWASYPDLCTQGNDVISFMF